MKKFFTVVTAGLLLAALSLAADNKVSDSVSVTAASAAVSATPIPAEMLLAAKKAPVKEVQTGTPVPESMRQSDIPVPCNADACRILHVGCCDANGNPTGVRGSAGSTCGS